MNFKSTDFYPKEHIEYNGVSLEYSALPAKEVLPSKGKLYGSPKFIYVRGLKYREQLELTMINDRTDEDQANELLFRVLPECVKVPGVEFHDLLMEDVAVIAMWVTLLTNKQQEYIMTYFCPNCSNDNARHVKLGDGEISYKDIESLESQDVDSTLGKLTLSPVSVAEVQEFTDSLDEDHRKYYFGAMYIKRLNGKELNMEERIRTFGLLDMDDAYAISEAIDKYVSGINPITHTCPLCGEINSITPEISLIKALP